MSDHQKALFLSQAIIKTCLEYFDDKEDFSPPIVMTAIAHAQRALKVAKRHGAKAHPRVAAIKKPAGCDPCSYPECGCAYSQDDNRRAGRRPVAALATPPHGNRRADAMRDDRSCTECENQFVDVGFRWCSHPTSDSELGLHPTYQMRYPDWPCGPDGRFWERKKG